MRDNDFVEPTDVLAKLSSRLRAWDGSEQQALALRQEARNLPEVRRAGKDVAERTLLMVHSAYRDHKGIGKSERFFQDPELAAMMGPFIGDPDLGPWPYQDPLYIPEEEAVKWLPLVGRHVLVVPDVRRFIGIMYRSRRRQVWVPASEALALAALRDPTCRYTLKSLWTWVLPDGLPKAWHGSLESAIKERSEQHFFRHILHTLCAWAAAGGDIKEMAGFSPSHFAGMALPSGDHADCSAVLLAHQALLNGKETRQDTLPHFLNRVHESPADEMVESVLRSISDDLKEDPAGAEVAVQIKKLLKEPRWKKAEGMKRLDALWSWMESAMWFHAHGEEDIVREMLDGAGEAKDVLRLRLYGTFPNDKTDAVDMVLSNLKILLDPDISATTSEAIKTVRLTELILLLEREEIAPLSWRSLVGRAVGKEAVGRMQPGPVYKVAKADLVLHVAPKKETPALLMRDMLFEENVVLEMASFENGFVARQVAVQVERLLRERGTADEQIKLLWRLLQLKPHPHRIIFRELLPNLRGEAGESTPLHDLVKAVCELDKLREEKCGIQDVIERFECIARHASGLLAKNSGVETQKNDLASTLQAPEGGGDNHRDSMRMEDAILSIAEDMKIARPLLEAKNEAIGSEKWLRDFHKILLGEEHGGLYEWMKWLGTPLPDLQEVRKSFEDTIKSLHASRPAVVFAQCDGAETAYRRLKEQLQRRAWPEELILNDIYARLDAWLDACRAEAHRHQRAEENLNRILDAGDEEGAMAIVDDVDALNGLSAEDVRRLARFLFNHLLFRQVAKLRKTVGTRVMIPSTWWQFAPLFLAVIAGPIVMQEFGRAFNQALLEKHWMSSMTNIFLAHLLCIYIFYSKLAVHLNGAIIGWGQKLRRVLPRILLPYVSAWGVAFVVSLILLITCNGTEIRPEGTEVGLLPHALLWSSISLFLGVFLELLLNERSFSRWEI